MASKIQHLRAIGKGTSPADGDGVAGEFALAFPNAAGSNTDVVVWAHDGSKWVRANPAVSITTQSINLGNAGADIGAGFTAWQTADPVNNKLTGNVVIATYGSPAQAYVLTDSTAPDAAASWTSLGGAVSFATAAEIHTGTDTTKALNSAILRGETLKTPSTGTAAAADEDKLIRLDANGQIDSKFLPAFPTHMRGSVDVTQAFAQPTTGANYGTGDMLFVKADGTADASWTGVGGQDVSAGDAFLFDGTNWHHVPNTADLNAYLALAGGTMDDGASITFDTSTGGAGTTIIAGDGGKIDNVVLDGGTY